MKILVLEDNAGRREMMRACLGDRFPQYEHVFFDSAREMIESFTDDLSDLLAISLDHDLEMKLGNGTMVDPGSGRDVVDRLIQQQPVCPVVIATTNSAAGDGMEFALREAGWQTSRIYPWGDLEWISTQWIRAVRDAIVASVHLRKSPV